MIDTLHNGMNEQMNADIEDQNIVARIEMTNGLNILAELKKANANASQCHEDEINFDEYIAWDDNTNVELDPRMVHKARQDEVEYVREMNLYIKVNIEECIKMTGKKPIAVRWIDVNKQDKANPLYRSRLVGKEFNTHNDMTLYAATPPLEALRLILSIAATNNNSGDYDTSSNNNTDGDGNDNENDANDPTNCDADKKQYLRRERGRRKGSE